MRGTHVPNQHSGREPLSQAVRKFANGFHRVFSESFDFLESCSESGQIIDEESFRAALYRSSRLYRVEFDQHLADIDHIANIIENDGQNEEISRKYEIAKYLSSTWHLCEIVVLNPTNMLSLEMAKWLLGSGVIVDVETAVLSFKNSPTPERIKSNTTEGVMGYWDTLYGLVLQGSLPEALEVLSLNSEIGSVVASAAERSSATNGSLGSEDVKFLQGTFELLSSHPFAHLLSTDSESAEISPNTALEFRDWQEKAQRLFGMSAPVFNRIPELTTLFLLLSGDRQTIVDLCNGDWMAVCLAFLIYAYPPPLTRANISRVVEEAISRTPVDGPSSTDSTEKAREAKQRQTMRSIINGDITLVLKSLIELGGWCSPIQDSGALFGLIAASHLTYLLSKAGAGVGLKGGIGSSAAALNELMGLGVEQHAGRLFFEYPNECSGVEELFLELSQRFNQLDYPLEIVLTYLKACPTQGLHYARALLPRRPVTSDATAIAIFSALQSLGWETEARYILATRGTWWLTHTLPGEANTVSANCHGGRVVKALRFFQLAGDLNRTTAILDRALWRCCAATVTASQALEKAEKSSSGERTKSTAEEVVDNIDVTTILSLLPRGLRMRAYTPRTPYVKGFPVSSTFADLRHYPEAAFIFDAVAPSSSATVAAATAGGAASSAMAVDESGNSSSNNDEPADAVEVLLTAVQDLLTALADAEQMLGAISCPDTHNSPELICLRVYIEIMTGVFRVDSGIDSSDIRLRGAELADQTESNSLESKVAMLKASAAKLCELITSDTVPMRFWLHLLDLAMGFESILSKLRTSAGSSDSNTSFTSNVTSKSSIFGSTYDAAPTASIQRPVSAEPKTSIPLTLFTKNQAYDLIRYSEHAMSVHNTMHFPNYDDKALETRRQLVQFPQYVATDEDMRTLRLALLGMYSAAMIQANAETGAIYRAERDRERQSQMAEFYSTRKALGAPKKGNAMKLLSASAYLQSHK